MSDSLQTRSLRWILISMLPALATAACAYQAPAISDDDAGVGSLAQALDGEEVIEVTSCSPGFIQLGEGPSMTCLPDPSWSDPGGGYPGGELPEGYGGGRGSGGRPGKTPKPKPPTQSRRVERSCKPADLQSPAASDCVQRGGEDVMNNHDVVHRVVCYRDGTKECCLEPATNQVPGIVRTCEYIE